MKEYHLICCGCKSPYVSKWRPKNNVWYCNKSCANHFNHRRHLEGKCHTCGLPTSSSRRYCPPCFIAYKNSRKVETKIKKKIYTREAVRSYLQRSKENSIQYMGGKCQLCGYNKYNGALQFHHVNEAEKSFTISGKCMSFDRVKAELKKCVMVCANCHGEIHGGLVPKKILLEKMVGPRGIKPRSAD